MHKLNRFLGALALLLPALSQAAGDAGSCRYVPIAKIDVDYSSQTRRVSVTGKVNGKPLPMLVDTGMYESRLLRNGADRLGLKLEPTGKYVYGVSGAAVTYRTHVDDFSLGASHTGRTVMPVLDLPQEIRHEAIVGADYLLQTDMELSIADKFMQFFRASGCADTYLAYWDQNAMEVPFIGKDKTFAHARTCMANSYMAEWHAAQGRQDQAEALKATLRTQCAPAPAPAPAPAQAQPAKP